MTLPAVVSDPDGECPNRYSVGVLHTPHVWRRGEGRLGWLLAWLGLSDRSPVEVCRYCGGRKP